MASSVVHVRVPDEHIEKFRDMCKSDYDRDANDMIRELIHAFTEGRVKITPSDSQKRERGELYHES